ncbi:cell division protein FtsL [Marinicella rhabdoformis]|uniref:cell division protein FtsL n=1 Tax=Marinicella rhabdoformis TaxID=2580566 RepID=UPI0012AEDD9E|nr:cell division protein FtsL [Marinicella rhabdoformis]
MFKLLLPLGLLVTLIAVMVSYVYTQNETRKVFAALQQLEDEKLQLKTEWGRLQIEKASKSASFRVAAVAKKELAMKLPENEQVMVIKR